MTVRNNLLKYILMVFTLIPISAMAHSSYDPIKDIDKKNHIVDVRQSEFEQAQSASQKIDNLRDQLSAMKSKILALRNLMASDYPHIAESMSKYKYDYMENIDATFEQLNNTLIQTDTLLNQ